MKVFVILMSLFLMKSCSENKNIEKIKIQYVAETRGYYYSVKIENKKFYVMNSRNGIPDEVILNKIEWALVSKLFDDIDLITFENLRGETNERKFDKKPFGNLFITKNDNKLQTQGFDHTIPPEEIKTFVDLILQYSKN